MQPVVTDWSATVRPTKGVFAFNVSHPYYREPEPRTPRLSEEGARTFDRDLGCWVKVRAPVSEPQPLPVKPVARPISDGSGVRWAVVDMRTDAVLWTFEAADFDRALVEKRRLCAIVGGKSGWARLYPVE